MYCHKCGNQVAEDSVFCYKCGAKLTADDMADTTQQSAMPDTLQQTQPPVYTAPLDTPKKKKSKKLPIFLVLTGLIFIVLLIIANSDELQERGEKAKQDEAYIASQQQSSTNNPSESSSFGHTTEEENTDWSVPYANKVQELAAEDYAPRFALIDLTGGDIPVLVADYYGYGIMVFHWTNGELVTLMDSPYGAGGNLGYEYLPGHNVIRNFNNDQAGAIVYETYMKVNDTHEVVDLYDKTLNLRYFKDTNSNAIMDENEPYSETAYYYYGDTEITAEEYADYQIPGNYEQITGDNSAEAMLLQLGVEIEADITVAGKLLYKGQALMCLLGSSPEELNKIFGAPTGGTPVNGEILYGGTEYYVYDDICFLLGEQGTAVNINVSADAVEMNGMTLNQNRAGIIDLLGVPWYEEQLPEDEAGEGRGDCYVMEYSEYDGGIITTTTIELPDVNSIANYVVISQYMDEPSDEDYQESNNYINDSFEWVETATGNTDSYGIVHVKGIVKNISTKTYSYLQISFNLYDSSGNQVDTATATIRNLKAGGTWSFDAVSMNGNVSRFEFSSIDGF